MNKKLVVSASLLAKSQVASYTRSDGTVVQAHDNGRQAAAPKAPIAGASASGGSTKYGAEYPSLAKNMGKRHIHSDYDSGDSAESREYAEHVSSEVTRGSTKYTHEHAAAALQHAGRLLLERAQKAERGKNLHIAKTAHDLGHKLLAQADKHTSAASGAQKAQAKPASKLAVRASAAKQAAAKTGSAAPAKMKNVGTDKWPLHAKSSDALGAKHPDGSTHHVGGFEPPVHGKGDHLIHHDGKTFSFSGKTGKNMKTGEDSFEYSDGDTGEHRAWVTRSGHLQND